MTVAYFAIIFIGCTQFMAIDAQNYTCSNGQVTQIVCKQRGQKTLCPAAYYGICESLNGTNICCPVANRRFEKIRKNDKNTTAEALEQSKDLTVTLMPSKNLTAPIKESIQNVTFTPTSTTSSRNSTQTVAVKPPKVNFTLSQLNFSKLAPNSLEEILLTTDLLLPKLKSVGPEDLVVSLSKRLIRGTCFDRYVYCAEFESLCAHSTFEMVMARKCALTCDRCNEMPPEKTSNATKCADFSSECPDNAHLCESPVHRLTMHTMCPRTCKVCTPFCMDRHDNCAAYGEEGFCSDPMYRQAEKEYLCGDTCKLCGTAKAASAESKLPELKHVLRHHRS
ncbi:unnamed protein product, partial [Mesorhabditis spiculigera]